ncbi:MAG: amidohydrolase family protein, partial [Pseudomonadota bacterium]
MTTLIKNGTVVTADLSYKADVLVDGGKIIEIGQGLSGDTVLDATGCFVMPGGIDPHTHLEMPFMGTYSSDDFESGTRAALTGGTTMVVDFALPAPEQGLLDAIQMWDNKSTRAYCDFSFHMAITWWSEQVFNEMATVVQEKGITSFKHFMAYKGALMVNDDEMFASFQRCAELGALPLVHAENGDVVADLQARLMAEGNSGPEAHAYSRPPQVEGEATNRAIMIADMAGVPLYVVHT